MQYSKAERRHIIEADFLEVDIICEALGRMIHDIGKQMGVIEGSGSIVDLTKIIPRIFDEKKEVLLSEDGNIDWETTVRQWVKLHNMFCRLCKEEGAMLEDF